VVALGDAWSVVVVVAFTSCVMALAVCCRHSRSRRYRRGDGMVAGGERRDVERGDAADERDVGAAGDWRAVAKKLTVPSVPGDGRDGGGERDRLTLIGRRAGGASVVVVATV